ncbi:enoyl-CoA hydratase/isomerase family protein [Syntrophomonas palmitatica]|uniref:enoyl-CoA hydratase/isomerase family protein n=1 Tax=Syntrophomonas palmitatica TaxID=402877 RepID=UPI0006CF3E7C|nr:enoyl-CoA hydratase-related protein [Syntrophomonas palmitatica]
MSYRDKEYKTMLVSFEDPGILTVTFNRPKAFNAVNSTFLDEIWEITVAAQEDPEVKVLVYTGAGQAFAAGADLKAVANYTAFEARDFLDKVHRAIFAVEDNHKPAIAAVNGLALGGGLEIVMACDIRIVADNATLGLPEINLGIYPGGGATQRMPRNTSICLAKQYIFTGDFFDAATAEKMGIVNMVVPQAEVVDAAKKMARKLARKSPLALREAKQAINMSMNMDIKSGCRIEQVGWSMLFASGDQKEGMSAFLENRKAEFKGK